MKSNQVETAVISMFVPKQEMTGPERVRTFRLLVAVAVVLFAVNWVVAPESQKVARDQYLSSIGISSDVTGR